MQNALRGIEDGDWSINRPRRLRKSGREKPGLPQKPAPSPASKSVLSQAEIEALLRPDLSDMDPAPQNRAEIRPRWIEPLDDAPSGKVRESEIEARLIASRLSHVFGKQLGLKAAVRAEAAGSPDRSVDRDFARGADQLILCFGEGAETTALLAVPARLADHLIAQACGGAATTGRDGGAERFTAMDFALLEQLLAPLAGVFKAPVSLHAVETGRDYALALMGALDLAMTRFSVEGLQYGARLDLVTAKAGQPSAEPGARAARSGARLTTVLTARMARLNVPLSRLSDLKPGSTLLLGLAPEEPVSLLSGGRDGDALFEGDLGRRQGRIAVRINRVVQPSGEGH